MGHPKVAVRLRLFGIDGRFDQSGCTVLYFFEIFNLGGGVWIPYRRGIFKFDLASVS